MHFRHNKLLTLSYKAALAAPSVTNTYAVNIAVTDYHDNYLPFFC